MGAVVTMWCAVSTAHASSPSQARVSTPSAVPAASDRETAAGLLRPAPAPSIVALTLTPGLLRAANIPVVVLSKNTLLARVTLVLGAPGAPQYTVRLLSSAGAERWRKSGVTPVRLGMRAAVTIDLPSRVLTGGECVLEVSPGGDSQRPERYRFRTVSR